MAGKSRNPSISKAMAELWIVLTEQLFDSYRPERHYMRGPGPKWHEKHARPAGTEPNLTGMAKASV